MILAISMALAAPLAYLLDREPFGIHIYGEGSIGKSTTAAAAASVWGRPGTDGFLQTWRNTMVAIEELASIYNHSILILDEIGEMENPRDLQKVVFMLTGGQSKGRGRVDGGIRAIKTWRTLFLSTGNGSMTQIIRQAGNKDMQMHAGGQAVRRIEIGVAKGEREIFNNLHGHKTGDEFAKAVLGGAREAYGVAGRAFLLEIIKRKSEIVSKWDDYLARDRQQKHTEVDARGGEGQQSRVYAHFQLLAFAGELATEIGLTGWEKGEAPRATLEIFRAWMQENKSVSSERMELIQHIRMILQTRNSSFSTGKGHIINGEQLGYKRLVDRDTGRIVSDANPSDDPTASGTYEQREFAVHAENTVYAYFITTEVFKRVFCTEFAAPTIINWLQMAGMYIRGRTTRMPGVNSKYYHVICDSDDTPAKPTAGEMTAAEAADDEPFI